MTPRQIVLAQAEAQSSQFEASYALRNVRQAHAEALRWDDLESHYEARAFALLAASCDEAAKLALPLLLRANECDKRERAAIEGRAVVAADHATRHQRTSNGLLDRAMAGLRELLALGKWKVSA